MSVQHQLHFTPGPVPVTDEVQYAMHDLQYHKTADFTKVHREVNSCLQNIIGTNTPIIIGPGSGTTGAEICMRGLVPFLSNVLVLVQGRFSSRWAELGRMFGHNAMSLKSPWGTYTSIDDLRSALDEYTFQSIWITHTETSTAITVPLKEYCDIIRSVSPDTLIIVDAVSSIGIEAINMTEYGIDCLFTASQKGLACPPGACILALSERAIDKASMYAEESMIFPSMVHDVPGMLSASMNHTSFFTPPLPILSSLQKSCKSILANASHFETLHMQSESIKAMIHNIDGCTATGNARGVTAIHHDNAKLIIQSLLEQGIVVAPGQDDWNDTVFRIGHMVQYSQSELHTLQEALIAICGRR